MRLGPTSQQSLRIAAIYAAFGAAWILFSDQLAAALAPDPATLTRISMLKGWLFIAVTALLLNHLVRRQLEAVATESRARAAADEARLHAERQRAQTSAAAEGVARRLAVASQAAQLGTWDWEIATGRLVCDERMHALYGMPPGADAAGFDTWFAIIHPDDSRSMRELVDATLAGQQDFHTQFRVLRPDGTIRHLEAHAMLLRDDTRRPLRLVGVNWDITERVAQEQRYRYLADYAGDVLWIIDLATRRYSYVSPAIRRLRGCEPEDLIGRPFEEGLTPASVEMIHRLLPARLQAFLAGDPAAVTQNHEVEHFQPDGTAARTEIVTTFIRNDRGGIDVVGVTRDISRRHAAEQALKESTRRLAHAEQIAGIGHWSLKLHADLIEGSPHAAALYGLPERASWSRAEIEQIALPEYRGVLDENLRALIEEGRPYNVTYKIRRPKDGAIVTIHSRAEFDAGSDNVFGTIQDVTEREQSVAALRASEAKLRLLVGNAPVVLFQIGADGLFRMSEGGGLISLGLRPGEVVGRSAYEVYHDHPQICAQIRASLAGQLVHQTIQLGTIWFEIFYTPMRDSVGAVTDVIGLAIDVTERKHTEARLRLESAALGAAAHAIVITDAQGSIESVNPAFTTLTGYTADEALGRNLGRLVRSGQQSEDFYRRLWQTVLAGETWHGEIVNRHKDGTLVPEEETITPVRDEAGRIAHFIAIKQDISERRRLQEQALRSQRLDSVGRLAGGIAHDLNNILAPMLMAPAILRESLHDAGSREILDAVEISASRGAAIIQQLLTFSRGGGGTPAPVQLRHVVREMLAIIRETFPKNIVTRTDLHSEPWLVEADATQLHQVLMNLCVNSRDAMPQGGTLTIALENVELDEAAVAGHPGAAAGPHVVLGVFDTGVGIAPEHLDSVFDPFFTTKAVGKGTGLGLATSLGIVHAHHGFIQVRSTLGTGTQVRVYLPAAVAASVPVPAPGDTLPPRGRGELILVVDDEENVRRITRRILEHHGYRVLAASDGAEALARYQQQRATVRLVLTDLLMPIMDGASLIRALHRIDPAIRVVAVSGHTTADDPLEIGKDVVALLAKPYLRPALLKTVAQALGS